MHYERAVSTVEAFLTSAVPLTMDDPKCRVIVNDTYRSSDPQVVVQVTEVSIMGNVNGHRGGISWMQDNLPWGLAVCAAAERLIVALRDDHDTDAIEDAQSALLWLFSPDLRSLVDLAGEVAHHG